MKLRYLFGLLTRNLFAGLLLAPLLAQAQPAGSTVVVPGQDWHSVTTSALSRGPDPAQRFQRVVALYAPADVLGIGPGLPLRSLGFRLRVPAAAAVSGTLRVWLRNATDTNFLLANDWAYLLQSPVPFQAVYNGPLVVPTTAGWYDVALQTPFAYAGGGFYLAYEWETTAPAAASPTYECDDYLPQSLRGDTSPTALPALLTQVSGYRPLLRVGYATPAQDAAVVRVSGPGKMAGQSCVAPYPVQAVVRNMGNQPLTNLLVSFVPGAGAGQPVTATVASLSPGAEASVRLPGLAPAASATGRYVQYSVQVAADQNPGNDSRRDSALATVRDLTYTRGYPFADYGTGYIGFNAPTANSGSLLCRYPLRAAALVSSIRVRLASVSTNVGNTVFGVVLGEQGQLLGRSADAVITASQNGGWLTLPLPAPVRVAGRFFFAGLAQTAPRVAGQYYYPLSTQAESPVRDSAYYSVVGDSALTGLKPPREFRALGRFMIEVNLESAPLAVRNALVPWVSVWPVPAHDYLHLKLPSSGTTVTVSLLGSTGQTARQTSPIVVRPDGLTTLDLRGLAPGLYVLNIQSDAWHLNKRILIE